MVSLQGLALDEREPFTLPCHYPFVSPSVKYKLLEGRECIEFILSLAKHSIMPFLQQLMSVYE